MTVQGAPIALLASVDEPMARTSDVLSVVTMAVLALSMLAYTGYLAMADGRLYAQGTPPEVLTRDTVRAVFGLDSWIIPDPTSGRPMMLPIGRHRMAAE